MALDLKYARPTLAVNCVVFGLAPTGLQALLIRQTAGPHVGRWGVAGGPVLLNEDLLVAARRWLDHDTGVADLPLEQVHTFGELQRDPRGRVVTVAYHALAQRDDPRFVPGLKAGGRGWFGLGELPTLAFDHDQLIAAALARLQADTRAGPAALPLLPPEFTLSQLQHLYEAVLGVPVDKRNFRRKMLDSGMFVDVQRKQHKVPHRAARFYAFARERYAALSRANARFAI